MIHQIKLMKKHINTVPFRRFLYYAQSFKQDLSGWCVTNIVSEQAGFSDGSPLTKANKPVWGTCP